MVKTGFVTLYSNLQHPFKNKKIPTTISCGQDQYNSMNHLHISIRQPDRSCSKSKIAYRRNIYSCFKSFSNHKYI
jgi:hypothetical protein